MKVKDLVTGGILETDNAFVIEQFKKNPDRYKEVKPETKKTTKNDK